MDKERCVTIIITVITHFFINIITIMIKIIITKTVITTAESSGNIHRVDYNITCIKCGDSHDASHTHTRASSVDTTKSKKKYETASAIFGRVQEALC